jgi:hypothetical protein
MKTFALRDRNLRRQVTAQNTLEYDDHADEGERVRDKPFGGYIKKVCLAAAFCIFMRASPVNFGLLGGNGNTLK